MGLENTFFLEFILFPMHQSIHSMIMMHIGGLLTELYWSVQVLPSGEPLYCQSQVPLTVTLSIINNDDNIFRCMLKNINPRFMSSIK